MATAYNGMHTGDAAEEPQRPNQDDDVDNEVIQQYIDMALIEMNNGNYDKAIKMLDEAKKIYPNSKAEELQTLIIKLRKNSTRQKTNGNNTASESSSSSVRQRKSSSGAATNNSESKSNADYSDEQVKLVKNIKSCRNFYQVLSVTQTASDSEIKRSYKKLALQLHPDKNQAPGAAEAFKTLGNAVAVLTDARKRKEYDLSGANYITPNGNNISSSYSNSAPSSYHHHQFYHSTSNPGSNSNRQYYNQHHNSTAENNSFNADGEDITAEELFNMFFGNFPSQGRYRRRPYQTANQRQPQEGQGQQPSLTFGLLLVMILISMFMSLFSSDPVYSLAHSGKYNIRRQTQHLSVPYYVKDNFESNYKGSLPRLENSVEEDYIYTMKQHCFRERSYREAMMTRARSFGSRSQFAQAQGLKMPSCDNLSKIGITRYSLY